MKVVTWNVNSLRTRLERVLAFVERHEPDLLCLQETKLSDDSFPLEAFSERGYQCAAWGQRGGYNGVATIVRGTIEAVDRGFDDNPAPDQARALSVTAAGVRLINLYVVNGQSVESDKYRLKLDWLDALIGWLERHHDPAQPLVILGDFNIAPDARDVHDPASWEGRILCSDPERERLQRLLDWGLTDLFRKHEAAEGIYSWWDYRHGAFHRNMGLRIDLILGTPSMAKRCTAVEIERNERKASTGPGKPSDHAPVIATFSD
jgi:exodeoxyribonuclease-3